MMSPTTSLGSPFSAESCARPVTSSRFIAGAPPLLQFSHRPRLRGDISRGRRRLEATAPGRQKKWGRPTFSGARGSRASTGKPLTKLYQKAATSRVWPPPALLCEVVPDHRELILQLVPEKDHRDDDRDRDDGDDECVFDQSLPGFVV